MAAAGVCDTPQFNPHVLVSSTQNPSRAIHVHLLLCVFLPCADETRGRSSVLCSHWRCGILGLADSHACTVGDVASAPEPSSPLDSGSCSRSSYMGVQHPA